LFGIIKLDKCEFSQLTLNFTLARSVKNGEYRSALIGDYNSVF